MSRTLTSLLAAPAAEGSSDGSDDGLGTDLELWGGAELDLVGRSPEEAAALIEGELVDSARMDLRAVSVGAVLDAFLDEEGRLVPARVAELLPLNDAEDPARALARARELDGIRTRAWSDATLRNYGRAVVGWREWCKAEGVAPLPFDPLQVANHLLDYTFAWDDQAGDYARNDEGELVARVSAGSVALRLAGLNKAAEFVGVAKPGENPGVAEVMRGIRRALGVDPVFRKAALDYDALLGCLRAATGATFTRARERALLLLKARCDATAGQLAGLSWDDVRFQERAVEIELRPTSRAGAARSVRVPRHRNPNLCLLAALKELSVLSARGAPGAAAVFAHRDGRRLSRQAPYLTLAKLTAGRGGWEALSAMSDRQLAGLIEGNVPRLPLPTARDRALLLTGFYTASRRSNLAALNWRDLADYGADGWEVVHRRSKTDQEGRGHRIWVPEGGGPECPARALRSWLREVTQALGRPPAPDEPVFAAMTAHGTLALTNRARLRRMTGRGINEVVQRLCVEAGLASSAAGRRNPYGAHSLRVGFVSESLRDDKLSVAEVQSVTNHKSVDVLMGYYRQVNSAKRNPSRKLIAQLGEATG